MNRSLHPKTKIGLWGVTLGLILMAIQKQFDLSHPFAPGLVLEETANLPLSSSRLYYTLAAALYFGCLTGVLLRFLRGNLLVK